MKCPECGNNQRTKLGMNCSGCKYQFTFNPKDRHSKKITDGKFLSWIRRASQNDTVYFTMNQLYAIASRPDEKSHWKGRVVGGLMIAVSLIFIVPLPPIGIMLLVGGSIILGANLLTSKLERDQFDKLVRQWRDQGKPLERLLETPSLHSPPPEWEEPDIYDYGVQRLLIVERDLLVDLFVLNGQHGEQQMLVIAESGYPQYLLPRARQLLEQQPDLKVFLLHDATQDGVAMEERIRRSGLLPVGGHEVFDLGMFPDDFKKLKRTRGYSPNDQERRLPVDSLLMPTLAAGLGTALIGEIAFASLLDDDLVDGKARRAMDSSSSSFG